MKPQPAKSPAIGRRIARFLAAWCSGLLFLISGNAVRAAVGADVAAKLRAAIRLPEVSLNFEFGFTQVMDWHGDDDIPDPDGEIAELRKRLNGGVEDARVLYRIAMITRASGPAERQRTTLTEALDSARRWVAEAPSDIGAKVNLAEVQRLRGEFDESERILALLTGEGSRHAAAFAAMARLQIRRGDVAWIAHIERGMQSIVTGKNRPTETEAREARHRYSKAMEMAARATELQPDEARHHLIRVRVRAMQALLEVATTHEPDPVKAAGRMVDAVLPQAGVPDIEAASRVRPDDARILLGLILHMASRQLGEVMTADRSEGPRDILQSLDEPTRDKVRTVLARLDRLANSNDPRQAAQAVEALGFVRGMLAFNTRVLQELGLRAFRLDPRRGQSFDMGLGGIVSSDRPDWALAESIIRERMRYDRGARMHLLLAKVLDSRDNGTAALDTLLEGLKRHPDSVHLHAAEFSLRLKRPDLAGAVAPPELFGRLQERLKNEPKGAELDVLQRRLFVTVSVAAALEGDLDVARRQIRELLASVPNDSYALEIARLLREIPDP